MFSHRWDELMASTLNFILPKVDFPFAIKTKDYMIFLLSLLENFGKRKNRGT
jgi:hypothetical protein